MNAAVCMFPNKSSTVLKNEKVRQKPERQPNNRFGAFRVDQFSIFYQFKNVGHNDSWHWRFDAAASNDVDERKNIFEGPIC